jgi:hypothetical protein
MKRQRMKTSEEVGSGSTVVVSNSHYRGKGARKRKQPGDFEMEQYRKYPKKWLVT